jgi:integrase
MAGLQLRGDTYRVHFRYKGKQLFFTLGQVSEQEADAKVAQVDYLLMRLKQRLISIPDGVDVVAFLQFDGKTETKPAAPVAVTVVSLSNLRDRYVSTHRGSLEDSTLATSEMHFRHLIKWFGGKFPIAELSLADLQGYVDERSKAAGAKGRRLSATTIRKEIVTLRTAWNWALKMKLFLASFPQDGLRYPKSTEKPPFQTFGEIERHVKSCATEAEISDLYDSLYLQLDETVELLEFVRERAAHDFIYPMFCCATHTGARRSELLRMKIADVDLTGKTITIKEKKRVRGMSTTRRVPMSAFLIQVLTDWLKNHPGGPWLFCHRHVVERSRTRSRETGYVAGKHRPTTDSGRRATIRVRDNVLPCPLTIDESNHHFKKTLANGKWQVVKGWHTLRHTFVSACASKGVDQRLVESWAGHMSPEMNRRYAHLYPSAQQQALSSVFDSRSA